MQSLAQRPSIQPAPEEQADDEFVFPYDEQEMLAEREEVETMRRQRNTVRRMRQWEGY